jgi:hypothetical protein
LPDGAECIYNADCCNDCCCTLHFSPGGCHTESNCFAFGGGCRAY